MSAIDFKNTTRRNIRNVSNNGSMAWMEHNRNTAAMPSPIIQINQSGAEQEQSTASMEHRWYTRI